MTGYINTLTGEYPVYRGDIAMEHGDELPEWYEPVADADLLDLADDERFEELPPIKIDGVWVRQFSATKISQEEMALMAEERNRVIAMLHGNPEREETSQPNTANGTAPDVIG